MVRTRIAGIVAAIWLPMMSCLDRDSKKSASTTPAITQKSSEPVIAKIGTTEIYTSEFKDYVATLSPTMRARAGTRQGRHEILLEYLNQRELIEKAHAAGVDKNPEFQRQKRALEEILLTRFYVQQVTAQTQVSTAEAQAYYQAHREEYIDGMLHASHIVCRSLGEAEKAQNMLLAGITFGDVAMSLSLDRASAKNGGKLPPTRTGTLDPAFERIVRGLKKGRISDPVPTKAGFEIIRKDDVIEGSPKPFTAVQQDIIAHLTSQKVYQKIGEKKYAITIDEKQLDNLPLSPQ
jgi:peptidyl-prolyl cis-trans isomerase C